MPPPKKNTPLQRDPLTVEPQGLDLALAPQLATPARPSQQKNLEEMRAITQSQGAARAKHLLMDRLKKAIAVSDAQGMTDALADAALWNTLQKTPPQKLRTGDELIFDFDDMLRIACAKNRTQLIEPLYHAGANIHGFTSYIHMRTPMGEAASVGALDAIRALIRLGASPNARPGEDPLASDSPLPAKAESPLTKAKATRFCTETPLIGAAFHGRIDSLNLLLSLGAHIDRPDEAGNTPLHWAAGAGQTATVDWLLAHGADPLTPNHRGRTPLMSSAAMGHRDSTARLALRDPSALLIQDILGNEAAHHAASATRNGALLALLEVAGSTLRMDVPNHAGSTPRSIATSNTKIDFAATCALYEKAILISETPGPTDEQALGHSRLRL